MITKKRKTGDIGEKAVVGYLKRRFYSIIDRNFNCRWGELDIVAKRGKYICFVEVKTRGENSYGRPANAVDKFKQSKLIKCAYFYLKSSGEFYHLMPRFDVAEVYLTNNKISINYISNAFELNEENYYK